jgi:glycosyltransferase involved in cell wall biosynthesis
MDSIVIEQLASTKKSLRLAIVTETYPPEVNGVAKSLSRFVEGLCALNHEIQLIRPRQHSDKTAQPRSDLQEVLTSGLPIPNYPNLKMGLPAKKRLISHWMKRRPDVVHIVTEGPLGWSALEAARKLKIPVSSDFRTNFHSYSQHYGIGWLKRPIVGYLKKFHNKTSLTTVPTENMKHELIKIGFRNVQVLSRGVNSSLYSPTHRSQTLRSSWGVKDDDFVIVHVGRLAAEKNLELLIAAYQSMTRLDPRVKLVLVGDGPESSYVADRVPNAIFCGVRLDHDLAEHYASSDLFVFPSKTETFGNVTLEAMASGLPIIAFDYAAAAKYVTSGQNGILVNLSCDHEFSEAAIKLHKVFTNCPEEYKKMRVLAREAAVKESWPNVVNQFESMLMATAKSAIF